MKPGFCIICHSEPYLIDTAAVNEAILKFPLMHIPAMFDNRFSRTTLQKHVKECLKVAAVDLVAANKINSRLDADARYLHLTNQALEAVEAARDILLVNGELNFHPRSWEIQVVYLDYEDLHPFTGEPLEKVDTLDNVLKLLAGKKKKVKKSTLKAEDIRKTYREQMRLYKDLMDNYLRIFGAFKQDEAQDKLNDDLQAIRKTIEAAALKTKQTYLQMLKHFIQTYKETIRPDLLTLLKAEMLQLSAIRAQETPPNSLIGVTNPPDVTNQMPENPE